MNNRKSPNWAERYPGWALVTGASSGIGADLARGLARRQMPVALVARREDRLNALAEELRDGCGVEALAIPLDLTEPDMLGRLDEALAGRDVSLLVNNAGFGLAEPFHQQEPDRLRQMVELNCVVPTVLARHYIGPMVERRNGAHIAVASLAGFLPCPYFTVYSATKVFDLHLAEGLWAELRPFGVDSLALCPGFTVTEFQSVSGTNVGDGKAYGHKSADVAEAALRALGRRSFVMPGLMNRLLASAPRFLSRKLIARMAAAEGRKLIKPEALARLTEQERGGK